MNKLKDYILSILVLFLITHVFTKNMSNYLPKDGLVSFLACNLNTNNLIANHLTIKDVVAFSDDRLDNIAYYQ